MKLLLLAGFGFGMIVVAWGADIQVPPASWQPSFVAYNVTPIPTATATATATATSTPTPTPTP